jgi:molecular chaperone DnaK
MKLGEAIYKAQVEENAGQDDKGPAQASGQDDDIVDADFEDLGDNNKKS